VCCGGVDVKNILFDSLSHHCAFPPLARLVFKVGDNAVKDFRMIERHFLKDKLIKSYDFTFPFCLPNSTNEYEAVYDLPALPDGDSTFCCVGNSNFLW